MTGKLIKNEFKAGFHSIVNIYLAALITTAIVAVAFAFDIRWIVAIGSIAMIFVGIAVILVTMIAIISSYYKTLYRDQGYLSFTLPTTSGRLLFAKITAACVWMLISYLICAGMIFAMTSYVSTIVGDEEVAAIKTLLAMMSMLPDTGTVVQVIVLIALSLFVQISMLVAQIFFALTLSNVRPFQRQNVFFPAIIIFACVFAVTQIMNYILTSYVPLSLLISAEGVSFSVSHSMSVDGGLTFGLAGMLFGLVVTIILSVCNVWLMNHKINLR